MDRRSFYALVEKFFEAFTDWSMAKDPGKQILKIFFGNLERSEISGFI